MNKKLTAVITAIAVLSIGSPASAATPKPAPKPVAQKNQCSGRGNLAATSTSNRLMYGLVWLSPTSDWHADVLAVPWDYVFCTSSGPATVSSLTQPFAVHWTVKNIAAHQPVMAALVAGSHVSGHGVWR